MFIMAHSSAALFAVPLAARKAGALILLGSYMFPSADYHANLAEWSRPVMHLGGRLDGQARFSRLAFAALDAAACASKFGDRCVPCARNMLKCIPLYASMKPHDPVQVCRPE